MVSSVVELLRGDQSPFTECLVQDFEIKKVYVFFFNFFKIFRSVCMIHSY